MRALKVLVVGMGVLIIVGTVTLVVLVIQRAGKAVPSGAPVVVAPATGAVGAPLPAGLTLGQPPGTRIGGIAPGGEGRVAVWVQRPDGDRVVLLDTRSGQALGEVRVGE